MVVTSRGTRPTFEAAFGVRFGCGGAHCDLCSKKFTQTVFRSTTPLQDGGRPYMDLSTFADSRILTEDVDRTGSNGDDRHQ